MKYQVVEKMDWLYKLITFSTPPMRNSISSCESLCSDNASTSGQHSTKPREFQEPEAYYCLLEKAGIPLSGPF